jgi:hypothetical protein
LTLHFLKTLILNWIKDTYQTVFNQASLIKKQRQFAFLFAFILIGVGLYISYNKSFKEDSSLISAAIGLGLVAVGLLFPKILKWPLIIWLFTGKIMGEITSTLILGFIYFFVFTPVTLLKRFFTKPKKVDWVKRKNPEIDYKKLY